MAEHCCIRHISGSLPRLHAEVALVRSKLRGIKRIHCREPRIHAWRRIGRCRLEVCCTFKGGVAIRVRGRWREPRRRLQNRRRDGLPRRVILLRIHVPCRWRVVWCRGSDVYELLTVGIPPVANPRHALFVNRIRCSDLFAFCFLELCVLLLPLLLLLQLFPLFP